MKFEVEKSSVSEKFAGFFVSYRKILVAILAVLVVFVLGYGITCSVTSSSSKKGIEDIDSIVYNLTKDSASLDENALAERRETALKSLVEYNKASGVVGVRANMLSAEIKYSASLNEEAASFWMAAAEKGKKAYTAPLCYLNAGVAFENASKLDDAEKCYQKAVEYKDFDQISHAKFSLGRIKETKGDVAGAIEVYSDLYGSVPEDSWAKLAESRLISLENADKK